MKARLHPNALVPCPSSSSQRRHLALAEFCPVCNTPGRHTPRPSLAEIVARRRTANLRRSA